MKNPVELSSLLKRQIHNILYLSDEESGIIDKFVPKAEEKLEVLLKQINNKYYEKFNYLHSGQYAKFLYIISNLISENLGNNELADKIYYLNKIMNSIDVYHKVKLPDIFFWEHPLGTVLGRANYNNYFVVYQNCTVGGNYGINNEINYPSFGENVIMFSNSTVIGKSKIGNNVIISSQTYIKDEDIQDNSIVFGKSPNLIIKENKKEYNFFKSEK